jgi:hypothetical protein
MLEKKISLFTNNKGNEFLTQLEATLELSDKLDSVVEAVKAIPETVIPETLIPDYPSEMVISNLPDVQKVEITNLPTEKDDKEQLALLKEISQELKKKEEYAYDIEIDPTLKGQLRGERGADGVNGKDGIEITNTEVRDKLEALEGDERIDVSSIKGTEELIDDIAKSIIKAEIKKIPKPTVYMGSRGSSSSSGVQSVVAGTNVTVDNTDPLNPIVSASISGGGGSGDVVGPASAVDSNFASFNLTTGKLIKDSGSNASSFATSTQGTKADNAVVANTAITGATKTKITYDAKGLVTVGVDATTADIADSLNKRYVTDANLTTIGNQSGTNTGDETTATIKSKLSITTLSGSNTGDQTSIVGITGTIAQFNTACTDADFATGGGTATGTNTGDNATNTLYSGLAGSKQDNITLTTTGTSGAATLIGATLNIPQYSGGGGSLTKGIAEVDFGTNASESDIATVTVTDATITSTSYPSVSLYALATTDHDSDDYMAEGLIPYVSSVTNGVGFNISVRAPNLTWGKYKVTYQF